MRLINLKKRLVSLILALCMIISVSGAAFATAKASEYLSTYVISLEALGDGEMEIYYYVVGTGRMTKIGAQALYIDEYVNGSWSPYLTMTAAENDDFYGYNTASHAGFAYFTGTPGVEYRVTFMAYARNSSGSDTGTGTSLSETCQ